MTDFNLDIKISGRSPSKINFLPEPTIRLAHRIPHGKHSAQNFRRSLPGYCTPIMAPSSPWFSRTARLQKRKNLSKNQEYFLLTPGYSEFFRQNGSRVLPKYSISLTKSYSPNQQPKN